MSAGISRSSFLLGSGLGFSFFLVACGTSKDAPAPSALFPAAQLGEKIFKDTSLSASNTQSCATCHSPDAVHAPTNDFPAQFGGMAMDLQGVRQTPSIRYLSANKSFHFDKDGTPSGGFFWDGRADSLAEQAGAPFLNPVEMAMPSKAAVVAKLASASYAAEFKAVYGANIFNDPERAFQCMTLALQQYQQEDSAFHPYTSKYDAFLRGMATLTPQEVRGLALFNNPQKGNCAACHPSGRGENGSLPLFTDFTYDVLGVPRNPDLAANADPDHYDLGLGARIKGDLAGQEGLYSAFKVPSLRVTSPRAGSSFTMGDSKH